MIPSVHLVLKQAPVLDQQEKTEKYGATGCFRAQEKDAVIFLADINRFKGCWSW